MGRVLVIDDNEDLQDSYEMLLESEGYEVRRASEGLSGLQAVRRDRPDVVILDMMMPDVDGLQFLARLPLEATTPLPEVIATSGFEAYRDEALKRGARVFLQKPIELDVLLAAVRSAAAREPVAANVMRHNAEDVVAARARASLLRDELVSSLSPRLIAGSKARLRALTRWLQRYYGFGASLVQLAYDDRLRVEAQRDAPLPWREGFEYPLRLSYCQDVIDGGPLLLNDPRQHPAAHFSRHPGTKAGFRFYAGAPLTTWSGAVIGTLCLVDVDPHVMHTEDLRLFEALGRHVAHALEELVAGFDIGDFIIDEEGLFAPEMLPLLTQVAVQRASRVGGVVAAGVLHLADARTVAEATRAAYDGADAPGVVVVRRSGENEMAVVVTGGSETRRTLAAALTGAVGAADVRAVGSAFCKLASGSYGEVTGYDSDLAARLLELAAETQRTGAIEAAVAARLESRRA